MKLTKYKNLWMWKYWNTLCMKNMYIQIKYENINKISKLKRNIKNNIKIPILQYSTHLFLEKY